jgi:hypothetical protein
MQMLPTNQIEEHRRRTLMTIPTKMTFREEIRTPPEQTPRIRNDTHDSRLNLMYRTPPTIFLSSGHSYSHTTSSPNFLTLISPSSQPNNLTHLKYKNQKYKKKRYNLSLLWTSCKSFNNANFCLFYHVARNARLLPPRPELPPISNSLAFRRITFPYRPRYFRQHRR